MKKFSFVIGLICIFSSFTHAAENRFGVGVLYVEDEISFTNPYAVWEYYSGDSWAFEMGAGGGGSDGPVDMDLAFSAKAKYGTTTGGTFFYAALGAAYYELSLGSRTADGTGATLGLGIDTNLGDSKWRFGFSYDRGFGDIEDSNIVIATFKYGF